MFPLEDAASPAPVMPELGPGVAGLPVGGVAGLAPEATLLSPEEGGTLAALPLGEAGLASEDAA